MVICPDCGCPMDFEARIIATRRVKCENCAWTGDSSRLIEVLGSGSAADVDTFKILYHYIAQNIAPAVGVKMIQLNLLARDKDAASLRKTAGVLSSGTRGLFNGLVTALAEAEGVVDEQE